MSKTKNAPTQAEIPVAESYEAAVGELESLIAQIEGGQMPLAQLLTGYQRGAALLAFARGQLSGLEQQIVVLDQGKVSAWNETP